MAVQLEIKAQLAKLLATEDLVVEHRRVRTAQFDVHSRVLTLPLWEKASGTVYDLLVGHEVGHALYSPDVDWSLECNVPPQFVNVVEDARIEKLMKRKYMGLAKTFYSGYQELDNEDFFELDGKDLSTYNLADKVNLYFKLGTLISLDFTDEEQKILNLIKDCETFTDTLSAAEALYNFCKQKSQKEKTQQDSFDDDKNSGMDNTRSNIDDDTSDSGDSDDTDVEDSDDSDSGGTAGNLDIKTADALSENLEDLASDHGLENVYVEFPDVNLDTIIASNEEFHTLCDTNFSEQQEDCNVSRERFLEKKMDIFGLADLSFNNFKKNAQKEVNYLVKEFECKKSADSYARSTIAKTGVLSTEKLHTYKFNEDLFKKVSVLPDDKNHGLIFILDWSGSMAHVLQDTIKQLYNLVWFCRKVSIPFEVYAFSNTWNSYRNCGEVPPQHAKREAGKFQIDSEFSLLNIFTSKVNNKTLNHHMKNIWRFAYYYTRCPDYSLPYRASLSGTPLNESLIALYKILPKFQKDNNLQKVQCVILTDGEANQLPYYVDIPTNDGGFRVGCRNVNSEKTIIRNRKTGKTYKFGYRWSDFTDACLRNLRDTYPSVNFIGIRVLANRDANSFLKLYYSHHTDEYMSYIRLQNDWKKNKSFVIKNSGYHAYFGMSANSLANDDSFEVKEDATKSQIKNAFIKSLKTKKLNKKVLGEFISLVV